MKCCCSCGKVKKLLAVLVAAYALVLGGTYAFQRSLMYHPSPVPFDPTITGLALQKMESNGAGGKLAHYYLLPQDQSKPVIVYFQGNAGGLDREGRVAKFKEWAVQGYGMLLVGYPGFGNAGSPSEIALYEAGRGAIAGLTGLSGLQPAKSLVFYGESLGTGVATQMATEIKPLALVLEAPYTSFADVGAVHYPYLPVKLLIKDRYETLAKIASVAAPVLVMHGLDDETVPFPEEQKVFEAANEPKASYFPAMARHNDLYQYGAGAELATFLSSLPKE